MGYLWILLLVAIPIFGHIDQLPVYQWDEARLAHNALEMYHNGDWIVTYFEGAPDMWNTKPPLMIWLQVLCLHLFGINELAIRLPAMMAALATCMMLYWVIAYKIRKPLLGIISVAILISSEGYVRQHVIRSGDYDSLLILFTTASGIFFFLFLEEEKRRTRNLYLFFAALTLGFLTKGIPILIFLPAMIGYAIWRRQLHLLLKSRHTYIGALLFIALCGGYYLMREHRNPGYLEAVLYNDITGRYLHTDMTNGDDHEYYLRLLTGKLFSYWYLLIIPAMLIGAVQKDDRLRHFSIYASLLAVFHFVVISRAQTKNDWYDAPIYPFLAIVVGQLLYSICALISQHVGTETTLKKNLLPAAFLVLLFTLPYTAIVGLSLNPRFPDTMEEESLMTYLRNLYHDRSRRPELALTWEGRKQDALWYLKLLADGGRPVAMLNMRRLKAGDKVMVYEGAVKQYIDTSYKAAVIGSHNALTFYRIDSVKHRIAD